MPLLRKSLCGCDLRSGSIASGWITLFFGALFFFSLVLIMVFRDDVEDYMDTLRDDHHIAFDLTGFMDWFTMMILSSILCLVYLIFTCAMMYGCREERRVFLLPWLLMTSLEVFAVLVGLLMTLVSIGDVQPLWSAITAVCGFVSLVVYVYMLLIVISYYQYLKDTQDGYYPPTEMRKM